MTDKIIMQFLHSTFHSSLFTFTLRYSLFTFPHLMLSYNIKPISYQQANFYILKVLTL